MESLSNGFLRPGKEWRVSARPRDPRRYVTVVCVRVSLRFLFLQIYNLNFCYLNLSVCAACYCTRIYCMVSLLCASSLRAGLVAPWNWNFLGEGRQRLLAVSLLRPRFRPTAFTEPLNGLRRMVRARRQRPPHCGRALAYHVMHPRRTCSACAAPSASSTGCSCSAAS